MAEYIEREKVLELINNWKRHDGIKHCVDYVAGWNEALEQIESNVAEDVPAADVAPAIRGVWLERTDGGEGFVCSHCKGGYALYGVSSYCPNCGAKIYRLQLCWKHDEAK